MPFQKLLKNSEGEQSEVTPVEAQTSWCRMVPSLTNRPPPPKKKAESRRVRFSFAFRLITHRLTQFTMAFEGLT